MVVLTATNNVLTTNQICVRSTALFYGLRIDGKGFSSIPPHQSNGVLRWRRPEQESLLVGKHKLKKSERKNINVSKTIINTIYSILVRNYNILTTSYICHFILFYKFTNILSFNFLHDE